MQWNRPATTGAWALVIARVAWVVIATFGVFVFIVTLPSYYHHALSLGGDHCCVARNPAEWRAGLHQLHLTPAIYAGFALGAQIVLSTAMFAIGLVIFLRKSNQWIGLFISLELVCFGLVAANTEPVGFPAWVKMGADALNNTAFLSFAFIPLVFPNGRFVPRWSIVLVGIVGVAIGVGPFVSGSPLDSANWPGILNLILVLFVIGTILLSPIYRYFRVSNRVEREQTKWVMFSLIIAIGAFLLIGGLIPNIPGITAHPVQAILVDLATQTAMGLAFLLVPVGFAVAILRYKLWDIDVLINRTLVYGSLTITLVGLYIGSVIVLQALFRAVTGQHSDLAIAIATLAVAAIFNPWRHRLQAFIDQRFYRRKYDAGQILARFSAALRDEVDLDQLTGDLLSVAHDTVQPVSAGLWLREPGGTS
jgi:hypothetical protein